MEQLYFLSIVFNSFGGLILIADNFSEKYPFFSKLSSMSKNIGFRLILSILTIIIALIILVWSFDSIPVIGDFFPAVAGILVASTLILDYMSSKSEPVSDTVKLLNGALVNNKLFIGIGAIVVSILHFFLPAVPMF
ncbi:MAG: hypothetical protein JW904_09795 [Spirochaetales bacterium]|nr:hypothetical protein [Spirochaetales bacterium]